MLGVEEADDFAHRVPKLTLHPLGRNTHRDQPVRLHKDATSMSTSQGSLPTTADLSRL